jgi:hypothetical protein
MRRAEPRVARQFGAALSPTRLHRLWLPATALGHNLPDLQGVPTPLPLVMERTQPLRDRRPLAPPDPTGLQNRLQTPRLQWPSCPLPLIVQTAETPTERNPLAPLHRAGTARRLRRDECRVTIRSQTAIVRPAPRRRGPLGALAARHLAAHLLTSRAPHLRQYQLVSVVLMVGRPGQGAARRSGSQPGGR